MSDNWLNKISWSAEGLVPVIAQDANTGSVLMMAWMNREAVTANYSVRRGHILVAFA